MIFLQAVIIPDIDLTTKDKNKYSHYIEAVSIENQHRESNPDAEDDPSNDTATSSCGLVTFSNKDYAAIRVSLYSKIH